MILFLRLVPLLVGLLEAGVFWAQRGNPTFYPWIVVVGVAAVPSASLLIAWGRVRFFDLLEKMTPSFLLIASLAFGLLLIEGTVPFMVMLALASVCSFISLELLFLLSYHPSAYPVNGLSRLNIAYVPLIVWYAVATSSGLRVFLHVNPAWHLVLVAALGVVLFRTTGHPGASLRQNAVWAVVGALVGFEVGAVGLLLPLSMEMQGLLAAILLCATLRARRYLYDPKPSRRMAWLEASAATSVFLMSLLSAKWL